MGCGACANDEQARGERMIEKELTWLASSDGKYQSMHGRSVIDTSRELQAWFPDWVRGKRREILAQDSIACGARSIPAGVGTRSWYPQRRTRKVAFRLERLLRVAI